MQEEEELIYRHFFSATRVQSFVISFNVIVGSPALSKHGPSWWRPKIAGDPCGLQVFQKMQQLSWHAHLPLATGIFGHFVEEWL